MATYTQNFDKVKASRRLDVTVPGTRGNLSTYTGRITSDEVLVLYVERYFPMAIVFDSQTPVSDFAAHYADYKIGMITSFEVYAVKKTDLLEV